MWREPESCTTRRDNGPSHGHASPRGHLISAQLLRLLSRSTFAEPRLFVHSLVRVRWKPPKNIWKMTLTNISYFLSLRKKSSVQFPGFHSTLHLELALVACGSIYYTFFGLIKKNNGRSRADVLPVRNLRYGGRVEHGPPNIHIPSSASLRECYCLAYK